MLGCFTRGWWAGPRKIQYDLRLALTAAHRLKSDFMTDMPEQGLLRQGAELFNRGEYFECHELFEQAWLGARDEKKKFLQGLIQVAVGLHHLRQNNTIGASRLLREGAAKLHEFSGSQEWIETRELLAAVEPILNMLTAGVADSRFARPQIQFRPTHA
jgi:hypothetical protein